MDAALSQKSTLLSCVPAAQNGGSSLRWPSPLRRSKEPDVPTRKNSQPLDMFFSLMKSDIVLIVGILSTELLCLPPQRTVVLHTIWRRRSSNSPAVFVSLFSSCRRRHGTVTERWATDGPGSFGELSNENDRRQQRVRAAREAEQGLDLAIGTSKGGGS